MKAELMALALLFAFVGFINSQVGPAVGDRAAQSMSAMANGVFQPWIDPLWQPSPAIQALLLGLQVAIGFIMVAYFLRQRSVERPDMDWD
jgi:cobalt transport protein